MIVAKATCVSRPKEGREGDKVDRTYVLLIDDDEVLRSSLSPVLWQQGF
jgi:hypothetical protein